MLTRRNPSLTRRPRPRANEEKPLSNAPPPGVELTSLCPCSSLCSQRAVFQGLSQEALSACIQSLLKASDIILKNKVSGARASCGSTALCCGVVVLWCCGVVWGRQGLCSSASASTNRAVSKE